LSTTGEGLQIDPKDPALRDLQDALLRDAQADAARSKQDATDLEATARAEQPFNRGLQRERDAMKFRRTGRIDAATRSFWGAAEQFKAAAVEARRVAREEEAEQARVAEQSATKKKEPSPVQAPAPQRPNLDDLSELEKPGVDQALRRYEAAYAGLSADALSSVYPSAPIDQLTFANYQSYSLTVKVDDYQFVFAANLTAVLVTCHIIHDLVPKSGQRTHFERSQVIHLEKQGRAWIIRQIRAKVSP
jgi:hypothetical protein